MSTILICFNFQRCGISNLSVDSFSFVLNCYLFPLGTRRHLHYGRNYFPESFWARCLLQKKWAVRKNETETHKALWTHGVMRMVNRCCCFFLYGGRTDNSRFMFCFLGGFFWGGECNVYSSKIMSWQKSMCPVSQWWAYFHKARKRVIRYVASRRFARRTLLRNIIF